MRRDDFERLYAEEASALLGFLVYRTGDRALAEDVLADTFERVLRSRAPFDPRRASRKTWLYSIALNRLRDLHRRDLAEQRAVTRVMEPSGAAAPAGQEVVHERDALERAMAVLTDEERETVALRFGSDLSLEEIARVAGTPVTTVKGRLYRALAKLREELS